MCYLQKLLIRSGEFVRGLPVTSDILEQICYRVANALLPTVNNLREGCQQLMAYLKEGCSSYVQRGCLCEMPLKKVKFKVKKQQQKQEAIDTLKNYQRFISK
jgi:hypothetical protein